MTALALALDAACLALLVHIAVNAALLRRPRRDAVVDERVSILMPMRNEAQRLTASLQSVLQQQGLRDMEVLVYDDASTDGTADRVRAVGGDAVRLLPAQPLPPGWLGKPHACAMLAAAATGTAYVFVDADVVLEPDAVAAAVSVMRDNRWGFAAPYPRQIARSLLERLVQPLLQWSWLSFLPLCVAEGARRPSLVAANGQLLAVDASAYREAGGHAAVRGAVVDDVALARVMRAAGARGGFADGHRIARCRMYDGPRDLVQGYAKSLWCAFGSPGAGAAVTGLLLVLYVVPWVLTASTPLAWVAVAAGIAGRVIAAWRVGDSVAAAVVHPLSIVAFAALFAVSLTRHRRGTLQWKARSLP